MPSGILTVNLQLDNCVEQTLLETEKYGKKKKNCISAAPNGLAKYSYVMTTDGRSDVITYQESTSFDTSPLTEHDGLQDGAGPITEKLRLESGVPHGVYSSGIWSHLGNTEQG
jgi:hypothetical protein